MAWYHRLFNVVRPERLSRDLEREIRSHLEERADDLVAEGMSAADATNEARRRFGNRALQKERAREVDGYAWLEALVADTRYAIRALRASPGFTLVAVLSLALGIGANTAIFSLTNAVALKSLPVAHPEELVALNLGSGGDSFTNPLWEQLRDQPSLFAGSFAYGGNSFNLANGGEVRRVRGNWVSGGFFPVLGVRPIAGRLLDRGDDVRGCPAVAVVSAGFAEREFGGAALAVGKTLSLEGHPFQVLGVVDPAFSGIEVGRAPGIYAPICSEVVTTGRPDLLDARSRWYLSVMARPRAGMSVAQLGARLALLAPGIYAATVPGNWGAADKREYLKGSLAVKAAAGGISDLRQSYRDALFALMIVVGMVLLIACANIANLLLARAAARQREIAIRLAIGASRWRLIRQLLTESLLLSFGGAALGVLFARWASRLLVRFLSTGSRPVWLDLTLDMRALAFTIGVATVTGVLFGLAPAWRASKVDPQMAMKSGGRAITAGRTSHRIGKALVIGQVALSLALVAAAALLLGSFLRLATLDPGFRRDGVVLAQMDFGAAGFKDRQLVTGPSELLRRIREVPGVTSASASMITPIGHMAWNDFVLVPGFRPPSHRDSLAYFNQVSDGYFATLGTALVAGRDILPADMEAGRSVAVINETMAHRLFGTGSAVGRSFRTPDADSTSPPREIVGVVRDAKYQRLDEVTPATAYFPIGVGDRPNPVVTFEVRTERSQAEVVRQVVALAAAASPAITLEISTLSGQVSESLARPRLLATLSGFFGALALLLAMIGLYGTMSYNVTQRRNEIGIRIALGAGNPRVLRMVAGEAARLVAAGIALGGLLALATTRLLGSFLFGVTPTDTVTLASSAAVLALIGMLAALIPAVRASRLDPVEALREG